MPTGATGVLGAAASIFFAYVGFDAVSTAAEETKNPQRNVPIGLIGVAGHLHASSICWSPRGAIGAIGAQPVMDATGVSLSPGLARTGRALRQHRRQRRDRAAGLLEGSAGPCADSHRLADDRPAGRPRRGDRAAVGRADDDVRPDPRLLHDGARRPAAGEAGVGPSEVPHAARRDGRHRHRRGVRRGVAAGRQARRLFQLGHAVRVLHGGDRR